MNLHNLLIFLFSSLIASCSNSQSFTTVSVMGNTLSIDIPKGWNQLEIKSNLKIHNPNLIYLGKDTTNGCFINLESNSIILPNIKSNVTRELELLKIRNPITRIVSTTVDSVSNKIIIDYQGVYENTPCFFRHVVYLRHNQRFILNFRGHNDLNFRKDIEFITDNIQVK